MLKNVARLHELDRGRAFLPRRLHSFTVVTVVLLLAVLTVLKFFTIVGCYAYDWNDDRNHTFVNLFVARQILADGDVPQINFFNNFGTPLLGDALTYPFAFQALTYAFLPGPLAMTFNRGVLALLTISLLYLFYSRFAAKWPALLATAAAFFFSGFIWHFAHHHYQAAIFFFAFILLLQSFFGDGRLAARWFVLYAFIVFTAYVLSVSINLVLIAIPLLVAAGLALSSQRRSLGCSLTAIAATAALLATAPQTLSFLADIGASVRATTFYGEGLSLSLARTSLALIAQRDDWSLGEHHYPLALYFSLPLLICGALGCILLLRNACTRQYGVMVAALGILPVIVSVMLLVNGNIWRAIPYVRSTDLSRVFWFSNVFVALGLAVFLDKLLAERIPRRLLLLGACATIAVLATLIVTSTFWNLTSLNQLILGGWTIVIAFVALTAAPVPKVSFELNRGAAVGKSAIFFVIGLALLPPINYVLGLDTLPYCNPHYYYMNRPAFEPLRFLRHMAPKSRVVAGLPSIEGQDLTAVFGGILGSNGRSILMDGAFTDYLQKTDLIEFDGFLSAYHFKPPWDPAILSRFGIRYVISSGFAAELKAANWEIADKTDAGAARPLFLYGNRSQPTPFYLSDSEGRPKSFIRGYRFVGNTAEVELPVMKSANTLVATFTARDPWRVTVDGRSRSIEPPSEDRLIRVMVRPQDKILRLTYSRYDWLDVFGWAIIGFVTAAGTAAFCGSSPNRNI
jgi:hypothetical protein